MLTSSTRRLIGPTTAFTHETGKILAGHGKPIVEALSPSTGDCVQAVIASKKKNKDYRGGKLILIHQGKSLN